jgi:hypothetical protein
VVRVASCSRMVSTLVVRSSSLSALVGLAAMEGEFGQ